jgi:SAM-dependent methyltransferase
VDISARFVELARKDAPAGATFERLDARSMSWSEEFDAVVCLCQGAFGLMTTTGDDATIFGAMARAIRPGGTLALSAFNAYFSVRYHGDADFDAATGVSHEVTAVRSEEGVEQQVDLWTGCYTPRELSLLAQSAGLRVDHIYSVDPGSYRAASPTVESSEFLLIASKTPYRR